MKYKPDKKDNLIHDTLVYSCRIDPNNPIHALNYVTMDFYFFDKHRPYFSILDRPAIAAHFCLSAIKTFCPFYANS